jgi:hypothetical protein
MSLEQPPLPMISMSAAAARGSAVTDQPVDRGLADLFPKQHLKLLKLWPSGLCLLSQNPFRHNKTPDLKSRLDIF